MVHPLRMFAPLAIVLFAGCGPDATAAPVVAPSAGAPTEPPPSVGPDTAAPGSGAATEPNNPDTKTVFVHEKRVDCEGAGPQKCLQIRESASSDWTLFYSSIEGFKHEEGTRYELVVSVEKVPRPMADASSVTYKLVAIVSQKKVPAEN